MVELGPQAYKIVRQCMRQLDLLKNVWQTILPELVYSKSLGTILNDLCDEIIRKVVAREDISSAVANGLVNICEVIIERGPTIFAVRIIIQYQHLVNVFQLNFTCFILGSARCIDLCEALGEITTNQNDSQCIDGTDCRAVG